MTRVVFDIASTEKDLVGDQFSPECLERLALELPNLPVVDVGTGFAVGVVSSAAFDGHVLSGVAEMKILPDCEAYVVPLVGVLECRKGTDGARVITKGLLLQASLCAKPVDPTLRPVREECDDRAKDKAGM